MRYNEKRMFQLESLGSNISRTTKLRGQDYFNRRTVRILFADADFVSAQVAGSQDYEVDIERDQDVLIYSCDCPFFEGNFEVCKHVWATLLELEKQGHVRLWESRPPTELLPATPDPEENYLEALDFEDQDDEDFEALDIPPGRRLPSPATSSWNQILHRMHFHESDSELPPSWPPGREILYLIACTGHGIGVDLSIQVEVRDPKKNGEWKKPRPLSFSHDILSQLPDPIDRDILSRFIGVKRETWYYGPYESIYSFVPRRDDLYSIFPIISQTGRLYFRPPQTADIHPVRWDSAPWEFRIEVLPVDAGRQYEIKGILCRAEERLAVSQPDIFFREGAFILGDRICPYNGSFDWISFFHRENSFFVPGPEIYQWLESMFGMPSLPAIDLPEEIRMQEIKTDVRPIMRVRTRKESWGSVLLEGEMLFDYLGQTVSERQPAAGIVLPENRWLLRDVALEKSARNKLEETGFKKRRDYTGQSFWTIAQSRLPGAVRDLVDAGWLVEAEGKLFRKPDSFNFHISSGVDWFELRGTIDYEGVQVPIPRLLSALKRHENTIRLDDGSYGLLPEEWLRKYGALANLGTPKEDHLRFSRSQTGFLDALLASSPEASCDELFERIRNELRDFSGVVAADPPSGFQGVLRPYQRDGLGWLHFLNKFGFGGCLADDMGLGKTIQVLALIEERRSLRIAGQSADCPPSSLIVMPRSLIFNWRKEAERFTPELRILDHTGGERVRDYKHFDDYDVILTTYGTLRRDASFFKEKVFDYIILDEAQSIKNASTESAKAARLLRGNYRLALSGTPIENHLGELWSLFEFLNPGMLGAASIFKENVGKTDVLDHSLLAHALRPFLLRRTKDQVAKDLPAKIEQTLFCQLEDAQRALYNELRDHYRNALLKRVEKEGIQKSAIHILEALLRLRQAAIHPGLIDRARSDEPSAKLEMLLPQIAEVLEEGHKALIFSQFTSMLTILRRHLDKEGIVYEYLDGQTADRAGPVERFQNDPNSKLFLISLKAGGLGLNLTAAEYVYILDPWWNPAVEAQAIDRTHRIGQTRSVFAYRLIAKDTVEEKVLALQETKRKIAESIINEDNSIMRNLRPEDLEALLS
jgi:superfamily II DNA or RNA helicase